MNMIFIDLEWFPKGGETFLIGYAYNKRRHGQLYDKTLTHENIERLFYMVDYIVCYGPDVGRLENQHGIPLKEYYKCINLMRAVKEFMPWMDSYKLAEVEKFIGIERSERKYKENIFSIENDWHIPWKRLKVLQYNQEDVINMIDVFEYLRTQGANKKYFDSIVM